MFLQALWDSTWNQPGLRESRGKGNPTVWEHGDQLRHPFSGILSLRVDASIPPPPPQWSERLDQAPCHQDPLHFPGPNLLSFFHLDFPSGPQSPLHLRFNLSFMGQLKYRWCPQGLSHPPTYIPISCSHCSSSPFFGHFLAFPSILLSGRELL